MNKQIRWHYVIQNNLTHEVLIDSRGRKNFNGYTDKIQAENAAIGVRGENRLHPNIWDVCLIDSISKIVVTQYRKENSGSTIGAFLYHYGIDFRGNYSCSVEATSEGIGEIMRVFKEAGYEVEFVKKWEMTNV